MAEPRETCFSVPRVTLTGRVGLLKESGWDAPKTLDLAEELDLPRYAAVGILEGLFILTGRQAPRGDIGRFSNRHLARFVEWKGDPDALVCALVKTRWFDEHPRHRFLLHGWPKHRGDHVRKRLERMGLKPIVSGGRAAADRRTSGRRPAGVRPTVRSGPVPSGPVPSGRSSEDQGSSSDPQSRSPQLAPGEVPPWAIDLSKQLAQAVTSTRPGAIVPTTKAQLDKWAHEFTKIERRGVDPEEIARRCAWIFSEENVDRGRYAIVARSPRAIAEKWARIVDAMKRAELEKPETPSDRVARLVARGETT